MITFNEIVRSGEETVAVYFEVVFQHFLGGGERG
jgi:hypothetical protein